MIINLYNGEEKIEFKEDSHRYYRDSDTEKKKDGTPKKESIAGVTTFLGIIAKPFLINWAVGVTIDYLKNNLDKITEDPNKLLAEAKAEAERIKQDAADKGHLIHKWIEEHIKGLKPEMPQDEQVQKGVISFLEWKKEHNVEFLESEKFVYSRLHKYAGIIDIIAKVDGKLYLIDIKTGNNIYSEMFLQTAAYIKADMEERGTKYEGRIILRISKETEEEHNARMAGKSYEKEYKVFEAVYLDKNGSTVYRDFEAFLACLKLYRWKQEADKELM